MRSSLDLYAFTFVCEVNLDGVRLFDQWELLRLPWSRAFSLVSEVALRATSHTRLRARDHYTSSTLIGGKGGAGPSAFHIMLEGSMEYVNARWMLCLHGFLHVIERIMCRGHLDYFQKPPLAGKPYTKPGDHDTPNNHNRWFILFYRVWKPRMNRKFIEITFDWGHMSHMTSHYTRESVTTLHVFGGWVGTAFGHFLLGSHNLMVTGLQSCVWSAPNIYLAFHTLNWDHSI
jgi:hypothetical protein